MAPGQVQLLSRRERGGPPPGTVRRARLLPADSTVTVCGSEAPHISTITGRRRGGLVATVVGTAATTDEQYLSGRRAAHALGPTRGDGGLTGWKKTTSGAVWDAAGAAGPLHSETRALEAILSRGFQTDLPRAVADSPDWRDIIGHRDGRRGQHSASSRRRRHPLGDRKDHRVRAARLKRPIGPLSAAKICCRASARGGFEHRTSWAGDGHADAPRPKDSTEALIDLTSPAPASTAHPGPR